MPLAAILVLFLLLLGFAFRSDGLVAAALVGAPLGVALARLRGRVDALETELATLQRRAAVAAGAGPGAEPQTEPVPQPGPRAETPWPGAPTAGDSGRFELPDLELPTEPGPAETLSSAAWSPRPAQDRPSEAGEAVTAALAAVRGFFTDGNLVVRIGILVLFIGVAFLLKYAAEHSLIPLPLRLGGVAAGGLVLLGIGWRLRHSRRLYGLLLQGAGVGVTFLAAFAAVRLFGVLGPLPALAVMVALVAATGALAVVQDSMALAGSGIAGGFLAPVLVSTGTGSHVALFSYYAVLNVGIFGMAWFKAWKALNLQGFLFTFGVGTLWGARYYKPECFATVEPFLLLDFGLYLGVAILFATRQPPRLRGLVDGTLVFGLPLTVFALQGALVANWEYGLAWSALGLGVTYLVAAFVVRRLAGQGLSLLGEAFVALGATFLTVAVPLAFDRHWTSALWAAEGAALVWVGVRQSRVLARAAGVLLQGLAGLAFAAAGLARTGTLPILNGDFLGFLVLALAGLYSSFSLDRRAADLWPAERHLGTLLLVWGGVWWLSAGAHETDRFLPDAQAFTVFLAFLSGSGLVAGTMARRIDWTGLKLAGLALLPLLWALAGLDAALGLHSHPLAGWNGPAWALVLAVHGWLLYRFGEDWPEDARRLWHGAGLWLSVLLLGADLAWWGRHLWSGAAWQWAGWALPALAATAALVLADDRLPWPVRAFREDYRGRHLFPIALGLAAWVALSALTPADAAPLPYLPVLNPIAVIQLAALALLWHWSRTGPQGAWWLRPGVALVGLAALSGWVAQGVHHLAAVPYDARALFDSTLFEASLSMVWGFTALVATWLGNRRGERPVWVAGALLLGLVVAKLFVADLSGTGSVARIVSFIGVGAMMLAVGYLAPLPPRESGARV